MTAAQKIVRRLLQKEGLEDDFNEPDWKDALPLRHHTAKILQDNGFIHSSEPEERWTLETPWLVVTALGRDAWMLNGDGWRQSYNTSEDLLDTLHGLEAVRESLDDFVEPKDFAPQSWEEILRASDYSFTGIKPNRWTEGTSKEFNKDIGIIGDSLIQITVQDRKPKELSIYIGSVQYGQYSVLTAFHLPESKIPKVFSLEKVLKELLESGITEMDFYKTVAHWGGNLDRWVLENTEEDDDFVDMKELAPQGWLEILMTQGYNFTKMRRSQWNDGATVRANKTLGTVEGKEIRIKVQDRKPEGNLSVFVEADNSVIQAFHVPMDFIGKLHVLEEAVRSAMQTRDYNVFYHEISNMSRSLLRLEGMEEVEDYVPVPFEELMVMHGYKGVMAAGWTRSIGRDARVDIHPADEEGRHKVTFFSSNRPMWSRDWTEAEIADFLERGKLYRHLESVEDDDWKEIINLQLPKQGHVTKPTRWKDAPDGTIGKNYLGQVIRKQGTWMQIALTPGTTDNNEWRWSEAYELNNPTYLIYPMGLDLPAIKSISRHMRETAGDDLEMDFKEVSKPVGKIERWCFTQYELDHPEHLTRLNSNDEFYVHVDGTELAVVVERNGTVTNRWEDGTIGVPDEVRKLADEESTLWKPSYEQKDRAYDTTAHDWHDVVCTNLGFFISFVDERLKLKPRGLRGPEEPPE